MTEDISPELCFGLFLDLENFCHIFRRNSRELASELGTITERAKIFLANRGLFLNSEHLCAFARIMPGEIRECLQIYGWNCLTALSFAQSVAKGAQVADKLLAKYILDRIKGKKEKNDLPKHIGLMTGDSDFIKIVKALQGAGHVVHVFGWRLAFREEQKGIMSSRLRRSADEFISYEQLLEREPKKYKIEVPVAKIGTMKSHLAQARRNGR